MILFENLPEIKAHQISDPLLNYVIFFPQFFIEWEKISFAEMKEILDENNRTN